MEKELIALRNFRNKDVGKETEEIFRKIYGIEPSDNRLYDGKLNGKPVEIKSCLRRYKGRYGRVTFTGRQIKAIKLGVIRYILLRVIDNYNRDNERHFIIDTKDLRKIHKQPSWKRLVEHYI